MFNLVYAGDRIIETSTSTGTGTITLLGAYETNNQLTAAADGETVDFTINDGSGTDWETATGVYTHASRTLTRATIHESTNSGSAINLSASTHIVAVVPLSYLFNGIRDNIQDQLDSLNVVNVEDTTGGAVVVTFSGEEGQTVVYKNSGTNTLTINASSGDTFEGGGSSVISSADGDSITLTLVGTIIYIIAVVN